MTKAVCGVTHSAEDAAKEAYAPTSLRVGIIADDQTGACDTAAAFAAQGFVTEVGISPGARPSAGCQVWSRSIESRDLPADDLEQRLSEAFRGLPPDLAVFKKVDSVFRGNTLAEIAITLRLHPHATTWIAPAFPAAGRTCIDGVLHVKDASGEYRLEMQTELQKGGVQTRLLRRGEAREQADDAACKQTIETPRAILCDAITQADLEEFAMHAQSCGGENLWIGSAGLAHAMASTWRRSEPLTDGLPVQGGPPNGTVVFFIGSTHAATIAQMRALRACATEEDHVHIVEVGAADASLAIWNAMERYAAHPPAGIFVTGGDTAALVFNALKMEALRITGEFAPGVPYGTAVGGPCDGVTVLLKSGGFGHRNVLCEIASWFHSPRYAEKVGTS